MNESITSLDALASQANENHQLAEATAGSALEYARRSGAALVEAKALVKHGEWIGWLEANFNASRMTASRYMRLSNVTCELHMASASINEALRMIAGEDEEEEVHEEPEAELFDEPEYEVEPQHGEIGNEQPEGEQEQEEARSVAVEIVDEDEELVDEDIQDRPTPEAGVALVYARTAIDALNKIPKRDPSRKAAIQMISDWLNKQ